MSSISLAKELYDEQVEIEKAIDEYANQPGEWTTVQLHEEPGEIIIRQASRITLLEAALNNIIENVDRGDFLITVAGSYDEPEHPANLDFARAVLSAKQL